ncbi:MAG: extracellular solute-binding protein [Chloroflexota bacterium]|nr:extracellular solute-binding protein [Chloroflexota bacterium]
MTHSRTSRRVALLAAGALAGAAFTVTPVVAQGDPNVCDGVIEGPVELTIMVHTGTNPGAEQESVDAFNAGPGAELGITLETIPLPETAFETAIRSAAASGTLADLFDMDGPTLYPFAWAGIARSIDSCVSQEKRDEFLGSIIQQGTYEGELYSLGSFESGLGLWAHKSMLDEVGARIPAGIDDAWTADEFTQILKDLEAAGHSTPLDIKWWYGAGEWRPYGFAPMIQSAGGDIIDRNTWDTADGALNGPEAVGAFTTFQGWVNDGLVDMDALDDNNFIVGADGEANTGDEVAISWVGHWMSPAYGEALGDDLVLLPLPDFGNGSKTGMGSWNWAATSGPDGVPNSGDEADLDAVYAYIDFVTGPEEIDRFVTAFGAVPSTKTAIANSPNHMEGGSMAMYVDNLKAAHTDVSLVQAGAVPRPATPAYIFIRDEFSDLMADIVAGVDVQSRLDEAVQRIDQEIADAGYAE